MDGGWRQPDQRLGAARVRVRPRDFATRRDSDRCHHDGHRRRARDLHPGRPGAGGRHRRSAHRLSRPVPATSAGRRGALGVGGADTGSSLAHPSAAAPTPSPAAPTPSPAAPTPTPATPTPGIAAPVPTPTPTPLPTPTPTPTPCRRRPRRRPRPRRPHRRRRSCRPGERPPSTDRCLRPCCRACDAYRPRCRSRIGTAAMALRRCRPGASTATSAPGRRSCCSATATPSRGSQRSCAWHRIADGDSSMSPGRCVRRLGSSRTAGRPARSCAPA